MDPSQSPRSRLGAMATSPSHPDPSWIQMPAYPSVTANQQDLLLHRAFGRTIAADLALDGLKAASGSGHVSVTMRESGRISEGPPIILHEPSRFRREWCADGARYTATGIGEFLIHDDGTKVSYSVSPGTRPGDVRHILSGPALIMALQLQGEFFLHAGAVVRDRSVFAIAAPHGFGKSTLTAAFYRAGCTVLSDDVVPVREQDGRFMGCQGQPWIKLWDNVLGQFGKDAREFEEVLDGLGKRIVPGVTVEGEVPLRTVYLLVPHMTADKSITIRRLTGLEGALALMANVYSPEIMVGELAARNLDFATRIAGSVPVRVVSYYRSFENLPNIRDAILRDFDEVIRA